MSALDDTASVLSGPPKQLIDENTYITGPKGYGEAYVFKQQKVRDVVQSNLRDCMEGQRYDPVKASKVTIGQKTGQAQRSVSRFLWDVHTDGAASEYYENESLFCVCQVYGLYFL
ncbi:hypothetical protein CVIRNUC_006061 [Coccomyxa viridis]|uniref:Dynein light chain n=1 Tax=Coccomyxa viridis TaxID=1274662 RepID=A0AAV1I681_9CHLO|nr:hypothetical protein CVIRNUC_006061 [Coccomyxa viridis]